MGIIYINFICLEIGLGYWVGLYDEVRKKLGVCFFVCIICFVCWFGIYELMFDVEWWGMICGCVWDGGDVFEVGDFVYFVMGEWVCFWMGLYGMVYVGDVELECVL